MALSVPLLSGLTYQWEMSADGGMSWQELHNDANYANVNARTLSVTPPLSFHGNQYRCRMSSLLSTTYSDVQTLQVNPLTKILVQPQTAEAWALDLVSFRVVAQALNPVYQWQVNKGTGWENLADNELYVGVNTASLNLQATAWYMHQYQYRCLVSGSCGPALSSEAATLRITDLFSYVTQPVPAETCSGKDMYFTVTVDDAEGFSYQWQESQDEGLSWTDITDGSTYAQTNTPTLQVKTSLDLHQFNYRCRMTRASDIFTTDAVNLSVLALPAVTAQPLSMITCVGSTAAFTLAATGSSLAYQWQVNTGSGTWTDLADGSAYQGTQSPTLALQAVPLEMNGYQYRCLLTGICPGSNYSTPATITVGGPGTWKGASPNWHAGSNWCGGVPTAATDITIKPGVPHMPQATAAFCRNLTIESGASITMTGDFTIQGTPTLLGVLTVGSDTLKLNGGPVQGNTANLQTQAATKLVLGGSETGIFVPAAVSTLHTLVVGNTHGVNLTGNLSVEKLVFKQGKLFLNTANLYLRQANNFTGVNTSRYIVTNDDPNVGGFLTQPVRNILTYVTFPIGTADSYSPAQIKLDLLASPDDFSVRVFDQLLAKGTWGTPVTTNAVNKTWLIEEAIEGGSMATVNLGWQEQAELPNFRKNAIKKGHYKDGKWEFSSGILALLIDQLNINWSESGGYTDFSPFTVVDQATAEQLSAPVVRLKVFLEGAFYTNKLRANITNYLPLTQPFNNPTYNYSGVENVAPDFFSLNKSIVDWVLLEIRSGTAASSVITKQACFILDSGAIVGLDGINAPIFPGLPPGNYYVAVRHRNHLAVMSAQPIAIHTETSLYDFTTGLNKYYGNEAKLLATNMYGMYGGDTNQSGLITTADLTPIRSNLNLTGYSILDSNLTGLVTTADITIINQNLNKYTRVP